MRARFQVAIKGGFGQQGRVLYGPDGIYLSMGSSILVVISFTDDRVIMHNHSSHKGICLGHPQAQARQLKAATHVYFVFFSKQGYSFIAIFD
jgi:hypothetical protein